MGFPICDIDFVHEYKKQNAQSAKVNEQMWVVDFESDHHDGADKTNGNQKDNSFGISEADDNGQCPAAVFPVSLTVFNVFDDFPDKVKKESKNGIGKH